jgi:signal recognition particle subunit SRP54
MHRQMADMMKAMGGKGRNAGMMRGLMGGMAQKMGLGGPMGGGMPDLSRMDPGQLDVLRKQAEAAGLGGGGLPGLRGMPRLPGLGGLPMPGQGKKK